MTKLPVWADRYALPSDATNTGKSGAWFPVAIAGGTIFLPGTILTDDAGNSIDAAAADPVGTERGLVTRNIAKKPGNHYRVVSPELTLATAVGVHPLISLWHPSTVALIYRVKKVTLYYKAKHTAGVGQYKMTFTSTDATGGTTTSTQPLNRGNPASGSITRVQPTGLPTLSGAMMTGETHALTAITGGMNDMMVAHYTAETDKSQAVEMRASQAEGVLIYQDVTSALTTAPIVVCEVEWSEEPI